MAFHGCAAVHAREDLPQYEFLVALCEYPSRAFFLRGISLLAVQMHAAQALVVLGMKCAVVHLIQGAIVYRLRGNGVFPEPAAVHFPVLAQLGQDVPAAILA